MHWYHIPEGIIAHHTHLRSLPGPETEVFGVTLRSVNGPGWTVTCAWPAIRSRGDHLPRLRLHGRKLARRTYLPNVIDYAPGRLDLHLVLIGIKARRLKPQGVAGPEGHVGRRDRHPGQLARRDGHLYCGALPVALHHQCRPTDLLGPEAPVRTQRAQGAVWLQVGDTATVLP